jgi:ubiquitin-conjugating enzyme E2 variant
METLARRPEDWISPRRDANLRALAAPAATAPPGWVGRVAGTVVREEQRPFWVKAFDVASVSALVVLLALATARLLHALGAGGPAWVLLPAAVAAVLAADLVSGLVHWTCDRFFAADTPLIGRMLIHPFREHHVDPLAITRHGVFELCGNNALAVLLPVLGIVLAGPPRGEASAIAGHGFVIALALAVFATNQVHKWAHAAHVATPIRWLQRTRLILSPDAHDRHHRGDFSNGYCVTTGWLNPLLDALRVLPRCEAWLRGIDPAAGSLRSRRAS